MPPADEQAWQGRDIVKFRMCETRMGWIGLGVEDGAVCACTLPLRSRNEALEEIMARGAREPADPLEVGGLLERLRRYAEGEAVDLSDGARIATGTPFQRDVWKVLTEIPRGETRSYAWVAQRIGRPRAARAVGQAVGSNPLPLLVPCHRVLASDGSLGGFGGGLEMKKRLLRLEGAQVSGSRPGRP
jgi:methylated-DNA-[protein]-cysteine S-methyltransferase